jgi:hypothetical protein
MAKSHSEHTELVEKTETKPKGWSFGTLFWGLLFVLVGSLFLLDNFNILEVQLDNIWQLWPLLIIGAGISFLNLRGIWWKVVSIVLVLATIGLVGFVMTSQNGLQFGQAKSQVHSETKVKRENDEIKKFDLNIETGAIGLKVGSQTGADFATATLDSNRRLTLKTDTQTSNDTQKTTISTKGNGFVWNTLGNTLNVRLSQSVPTKLLLDTGATSINADLSLVRLTDLTIDTGASSVDAKIGNKEANVTITIDAGASSITLRVPKETGVRVKHDGGATKIDFDDVDKKDNDIYESSNFSSAAQKITIKSDTGASTFTIRRY